MRGIKNRAWAALAAVCMMICMFVPGVSANEGQNPQEKAIPMDRLGAEIDQRYGAQGSGPVATGTGYKLAAKMQALEAEVTPAGLTVTSLAKKEGLGSFSIMPVALNGRALATPAKEAIRTEADGAVMLERGLLQERFTASSDGIRQDFIIIATPVASVPELVLSLAVQNAKVIISEKNPSSVVLTLDSGRRLAYRRLHVTDAAGKKLPARMEVPSTGGGELLIIVAARDVQYPVIIDPTIIDEDWESMNPGIPGVDADVNALAFDAAGTLYAGGSFTTAGGVSASGIAKWDGSSWSALGSGMDRTVHALAFDAAGTLYAGGDFKYAGDKSANYIAKWDGSSWSALGSGMDGTVYALAFDASGALYAGGGFTVAGYKHAYYIAKWDGSSWSALGGMSSTVHALAFDASGTLYAGGYFKYAGGTSANYIAKWNGSSWSALGSGMGGTSAPFVNALAVDAEGSLYAGGRFTTAGGVNANYIAKWDGSSWSALGSGVNELVNVLAFDASGTLYAGGYFTTAGGVSVNSIARWNGSSWSALGSGMNNISSVNALAVDDSGTLYAGGFFTTAGGVSANYIAAWEVSSWSALGPSGMNGSVRALAVDASSGTLYAGGWFMTAGSVNANGIAKWDGESWSALGSGMNSAVYALAVDALGTLYAGGYFTTAGGVSANYMAAWDGESWSAMGAGLNNYVDALVFDSSGTLYAGGYFTTAGGKSANHIAKWDGESWSALGSGLNNTVHALAVDASGTLYVGGVFSASGDVTPSHIAEWDGENWSALGSGLNSNVHALAVDASGILYAGGYFTGAGGVSANSIARWDGESWSALGSGMSPGVQALAVDASDTLYAGGDFTTAGGVSANYVARWDGESWSALGSGMNSSGYVAALAVNSSGNLYAGGDFMTAGDKISPYVARCNIPECDDDSECREGYQCVDRICEPIPDDPPVIGDGPYLAAGNWPVLPTSQENPIYLDANYDVLWKFSDDFASCPGPCTHFAEYQAVGGSEWKPIDVIANAAKGYAYVALPIESLNNATTYAFRYSVTDCASQTTQSAVYYFRVAVTDAPPVITSAPFVAANTWPALTTMASNAVVLDQNEYVLWTFSDDYASCAGLCTHRARYRLVGDTAWTWIQVSADPTGKKYAYTELPVEGLAAGTYHFWFDVRDCAGQLTKAPKIYYFKVE